MLAGFTLSRLAAHRRPHHQIVLESGVLLGGVHRQANAWTIYEDWATSSLVGGQTAAGTGEKVVGRARVLKAMFSARHSFIFLWPCCMSGTQSDWLNQLYPLLLAQCCYCSNHNSSWRLLAPFGSSRFQPIPLHWHQRMSLQSIFSQGFIEICKCPSAYKYYLICNF